MEIYLVPFSLLDLVCLSPLYAYITWYGYRKLMHKKRRFTGFMSWSFIIHATIIPLFWILHSFGAFSGVEDEVTKFDPVAIHDHPVGFFVVYLLFTGGLTMVTLGLVKKNSLS
ncbi:MAG TPA: hypothetical protein VK826_07670 [Bacteroidia bacterium]|nr:hypothetical protein [Bacteroidia bacterium]